MQNIVVAGKSRKYKKKIWIISLLIVLVIGVAGIVLFEVRWKPKLSQKMKDGVYNRSYQLYKLDFKDISFNFFTGSATLHQVSLTPDTSVYNQFKALRVAPANIYQIKLHKLHMKRISLLTAYLKREINIKAITLERPFINVFHYTVTPLPDILKGENEPTIYQMISNRIRSIDIKTIEIVDGDLDYIDGGTSKSLLSAKHLNVNLNGFLIDSLSQYDTARPYYVKDIDFERSEDKFISNDKLETIKSIVLSIFQKNMPEPRSK